MSSLIPNPNPPTEHRATIGDLEVRYLEWLPVGDPLPTPILALHGLASSGNWYERLAARLSSLLPGDCPRPARPRADYPGHQRLRLANPGRGTPSASWTTWGWSGPAVLGHSWGGNVAINVAAKFPERVSKLVMIDGGFLDGHILPDASWEVFRNRFAPRNVSGRRPEFLARLREQLADCWADDLERIVQTMVYEDEQGQNPGHLAARQSRAGLGGDVGRAAVGNPAQHPMPHPSSYPPGRARTGPGSDFNRTKTVMVEAAARAVPNNRVHWIPETIHDIGYHKPDDLAEAIMGFLEEDA